MNKYDEMKQKLIKGYVDLLEVQYHDKPKAKATIKLLIETLLADMVMFKIREECLNVDLSVGVQLDHIGKWVGVDRYFKGQMFDKFKLFGFNTYNDLNGDNLSHGFSTYDTFESDTGNGFLIYPLILSVKNKLNDDDFRILIKLKIVKNETNMTAKNIDDNIYQLFKNVVYTTWGECMEMTYNYDFKLSNIIELTKEKECLPAPTGVKINLKEINNG